MDLSLTLLPYQLLAGFLLHTAHIQYSSGTPEQQQPFFVSHVRQGLCVGTVGGFERQRKGRGAMVVIGDG